MYGRNNGQQGKINKQLRKDIFNDLCLFNYFSFYTI